MTTKSDPCASRPEEIAGGAPLTAPTERHLETCPACARVREDFARLDRALGSAETAEALAAEVPAGFADRVMARVHAVSAPRPVETLIERAVGIASAFLQIRAVQIALVGLGLALPLSGAH